MFPNKPAEEILDTLTKLGWNEQPSISCLLGEDLIADLVSSRTIDRLACSFC